MKKAYFINGLTVEVTTEKRSDIYTNIFFFINGKYWLRLWYSLHPKITRQWVSDTLKTYGKCQIEFLGDNSKYFTGRPSREGFEGPFIGVGDNEADAFQDAADMAYTAFYFPENLIPKRAGNKRRGFAHYFGRETAAECRKFPDHDLQIICVLYVPKPEPLKYIVPAWLIPVIANDDRSHLDGEEEFLMNEFFNDVHKNNGPGYWVAGEEESEFARNDVDNYTGKTWTAFYILSPSK